MYGDMMKLIIDKRNYIILFVIFLLIIWIVFNLNVKKNIFIKSFKYFNEIITYEIYDTIDSHSLNDIKNIYQNYNKDDVINYGKKLYKETNGYIDISDTDLISKLNDNQDYVFETKINDKNFKNYNLDSIISSYTTNEVLKYFKKNKIKKYLINENGNIIAGDYYKKNGRYNFSINKYGSNSPLKFVSFNNMSMVTLNKSKDLKSYMVNPKTSKIVSNFDSVTVISDDYLTADMLTKELYLMDINEGKETALKYNAEALWQKDGKVIMTEGFKKYIEVEK
jgi:hypothetical protein